MQQFSDGSQTVIRLTFFGGGFMMILSVSQNSEFSGESREPRASCVVVMKAS